ncbi:hypothetical protein [Actinomadura nitritigenes]|uniref:hypothetical protein n=1 Tax=Actinomadura nitritigenes TaxID=134602 RepID=UPI003D941DA3
MDAALPSRGAEDGERPGERHPVRFWTEQRIKIALLVWETVVTTVATIEVILGH